MRHTIFTGLLLAAACGNGGAGSAAAPAPTTSSPAAQPAAAEPAVPQLLEVGTPAPDFTATDHLGNEISLSALKGKPVVLFWYPKDDSPG